MYDGRVLDWVAGDGSWRLWNNGVKSRKVTESPVPEWLVGWWKVTWRGQAYYYSSTTIAR
jgi:hypothetical protein